MRPELLLMLRPEVLAPVTLLLGFVLGFGTRASISRRRRRRAQSSYLSDRTMPAGWLLQPPATKTVVVDTDGGRLPEIGDAPGIGEQVSAATLAGRLH
jgi:hypothetical protein